MYSDYKENIRDLTYEEIVLLQDIMLDIQQKGLFIEEYDIETLESLHQKIMQS